MDLFVRGTDGIPYHEWIGADSAVLHAWEPIGTGGHVLGAPVGSWNASGTKLDVYAVGTDRTLFHITSTATGWGAWTPMNDGGTAG